MIDKFVPFSTRHIGPKEQEIEAMLSAIGVSSLDALIDQAVPASIRYRESLKLPKALTEQEALTELKSIMAQNKIHKSFIGQGYYGTFIPAVILRNLFENPAWYTAYTPYQAEISQGRLELLFHFQTLIAELSGLPVAAASLLDEGTSLAEATAIAARFFRGKRKEILVAGALYPQNLEVVKTRAFTQDLDLHFGKEALSEKTAACVLPWPDNQGIFHDYSALIKKAKENGALVIVVADPLALTILEAPGKWGADIVVGSLQRFGTPMGYGGPHAGYLAVCEDLTRLIPGRIIGQSTDTKGRIGYRLALQTREQHIRRDKATSNICTAQALLANMSTAYAIWHGPAGLQNIAHFVHSLAARFALIMRENAFTVIGEHFFDCVTIKLIDQAEKVAQKAYEKGYLLRVLDKDHLSVTFDETSCLEDLSVLANIFGIKISEKIQNLQDKAFLPKMHRTEAFLSQPIFHSVSSETDMMRLLRRLADKDLALDRAMIPLGSCTMKLNAAAEMLPLSWDKVTDLHPFAPIKDAKGYHKMLDDLSNWLCEITGFSAISFQPNSGAQGEYAGLLAIRRYHESRAEQHRNICLIPESAHGTNPASAHMAGMQVVVVRCLEDGDVDVEDLKEKAEKYKENLSAFMITYPSTHGVYEEKIKEICQIIHDNGGQVYFDGANLNALVGLARPKDIGADVCHMNLHKTFSIPHGGGGPGAGPIGVAPHLIPFLPGDCLKEDAGQQDVAISEKRFSVSSAAFSSASILTITWMYIRMMGAEGLCKATKIAILNANYIAKILSKAYPILYKGKKGCVAHECIIDTRILKDKYGITVDDIAKRLIDYGFHAPTMSFPVPGTLMVEPTESEPKVEIDRLCRALLKIFEEAEKIGQNVWPKEDNPLINAPHNLEDVLSQDWLHCYSRKIAALPDEEMDPALKYWPPVSRIDNVAGDRNLICSCPPLSNYK